MSISRNRLRITDKMAFSLRSSLRILWTATTALVFLTRSSAAPTFGGTDKAMVSVNLYLYLKYLNIPLGMVIEMDFPNNVDKTFATYNLVLKD